MKFYILTFLILALATIGGRSNDLYPDKLAEKYARISLKDKDIFLKEKLELDAQRKAPLSLYRFGKQDAPDFYVVITQAKGRYEMFDYMLCLNLDLSVSCIRVLKYRSENGSEIGSKRWLKQFIGYSGGELRYKKDISAISGATISAKSITTDVQEVVQLVGTNVEKE